MLAPSVVFAQFHYWGPALYSTTLRFTTADTPNYFARIDTSFSTLWKVGNTLKPVFSNDTIPRYGMMTDTVHPYRTNANDYFLVKIFSAVNCIVDFWHRYQTDSLHAGGIVEFSTDSLTWINVATCSGITTENFYAITDTLHAGQPAFKGQSSGTQLSRFQLTNCMALRSTATACFPDLSYGIAPIFIRFRFVSDSVISSLSGWMIDSIKVEFTGCGEGISMVTPENVVNLYPNPVGNTITISGGAEITSLAFYNPMRQAVTGWHYHAQELTIDVSELPEGMYFVMINNTEVKKVLKE